MPRSAPAWCSGAVWSEEHGGTNGMGTCLFERAPLIIHRDQHFFSRNTGLTCCAAPIFDYRGELVAVLDASGESDRAQQHTLVLVNMSAQMIENRLFLNRFRDAFVVRFHSRPGAGRHLGRGHHCAGCRRDDRRARSQRPLPARLQERRRELIGAPLERVFNISLSALVGRSQKKSFHALPIYETRHGGRFFAVAQAPQSKRSQAGKQRIDARRRALRARRSAAACSMSSISAIPSMGRNIQAAKRLESRDIPILLVGRVGHRQGVLRARAACRERARRQALRRGQLRLAAGNAHAERVVRSRRRWRARRRGRSRPHRTGQRRHPVPG